MPRRSNPVPSYRLHKSSGQARVLIGGQHIYLGAYGSEASRQRYARLLAKQTATSKSSNRPQSAVTTLDRELTVAELVLRYWEFAETYYVKDDQPTKELVSMREALRPVRRLFGDTQAEQFGPKSLKLVREHMIDQGLSRKVINQRINRIKRAFKWAVAEELVPPAVFMVCRQSPACDSDGPRLGRPNPFGRPRKPPLKPCWPLSPPRWLP
jgi:hypothetical protein